MSKYRKKPVVIDAVQFTGQNIQEIWDEFGVADIYGPVEDDPCAYIFTLEGKMKVDIGDWVIQGVNGEHYPCKTDIFDKTYEEVT